ncbi:hypothetical protein RFI_34029 [Reticulomyxa filosa]|uniref:Uncharacterized protein n=1 Tax=Reticulomyxa filosa TaxID=46433 RepID=X6LRP2_RETFI|nr:hypothetical protein RFI_34029 [Reticulomyxa filosa]|eukprot:ETO03380.1 hypothetical protein RFI_34029 [Reticulomyxa filosa]
MLFQIIFFAKCWMSRYYKLHDFTQKVLEQKNIMQNQNTTQKSPERKTEQTKQIQFITSFKLWRSYSLHFLNLNVCHTNTKSSFVEVVTKWNIQQYTQFLSFSTFLFFCIRPSLINLIHKAWIDISLDDYITRNLKENLSSKLMTKFLNFLLLLLGILPFTTLTYDKTLSLFQCLLQIMSFYFYEILNLN